MFLYIGGFFHLNVKSSKKYVVCNIRNKNFITYSKFITSIYNII